MKINTTKLSFYSSFVFGLLFVFGLAVLLLKILPSFNSLITKACRQAGPYCQQSIPFSNPIISIPYFFLWALGSLIVAIGLASLFYQVLATLKFKRELLAKKIVPSLETAELFKKTGLQNKVYVISDSKIFSFCLGFISPKIYLSSAVLTKLNLAETEAVLLHEKYHLEHRDPLKILISQNIKRALFFLPIFKDLNDGYIIGKELAADKKAILVLENKKTLIEALIKIFTSQSELNYKGAITGPISVTKERIEALRETKKIKKLRISFLNIFFSLIIIASLFFIGKNVNSAASATVDSGCSCTADNQCITENQDYSCKTGESSCLMNSK